MSLPGINIVYYSFNPERERVFLKKMGYFNVSQILVQTLVHLLFILNIYKVVTIIQYCSSVSQIVKHTCDVYINNIFRKYHMSVV